MVEILSSLAIGTIYFLPAFVAYGRSHHQKAAVGVLNIFLGWTAIGWIVALVWAVTAVKHSSD